jgi:hypothetical protein
MWSASGISINEGNQAPSDPNGGARAVLLSPGEEA